MVALSQFTPNPTQDPSYFYTSPRSIQGIAPDESGKLLGQAIDQGLTGAGKLIDKGTQTYIDDSLHADIDPEMEKKNQDIAATINYVQTGTIAGEDGKPIKVADLLAKPKDQQTPADLANLETITKNLRQGRDHAVYNDVYFRMKMDETAKRYRTQFPGFRDFIDDKIKGAEGSTANQLAQAQIQTLNDLLAQRDQEKNKIDTFAREHYKYDNVRQYHAAYMANPTDANRDRLLDQIANEQNFDLKNDRFIKGVAIGKADEENQQRMLTPEVSSQLANIVSNSRKTNMPGIDPASPVSNADKALDYAIKVQTKQIPEDPNVDPVQTLRWSQALADRQFEAYLRTVTKSGKTIGDVIGQQKADELRNQHYAVGKAELEAATAGSKWMADYIKNVVESRKNAGVAAIQSNPEYDLLNKLGAINALIGNGPAGKALETYAASGTLLPAVDKLAMDKAVSMAIQTGRTLQDTIDETKKALEHSNIPPDVAKKDIAKITKFYIANSLNLIRDPAVNDEVKATIQKNVFGPGNESAIRDLADDRYDNNNRHIPGKHSIYYEYGQPDIMKEAHNPKWGAQNWNDYKFTMRNWAGKFLLPSAISQLNALQTDPNVKVGWSDTNGRVVVQGVPSERGFTAEQQMFQGTPPRRTEVDRQVLEKTQQAVEQINRVLIPLRNIAIEDKQEPNEYILNFLKTHGWSEFKDTKTPAAKILDALEHSMTFQNRFDASKDYFREQ